MNPRMYTRNVVIFGRRTKVRLEASIWSALDDICVRECMSRHDLCSRIEEVRGNANRAQAIRAAVVSYFRTLSMPGGSKGTVDAALNAVDDFAA